ncbi:hypothetical protein [Roseibium sp.]|uniref:hypothetical protein n=1 Tax=Roseibium sp. TaxID=1936156 RepID=UPI003BABFD2B
MTAAVYNFAGEARIPAYVWTAVLGVSVAAHVALLVYGISLTFTEDAQNPDITQTEIVIESDELVFETAEEIPSVVAEAAQPDAVTPQSAGQAALEPVLPEDIQQALTPSVSELQPAQIEAVRPVESETAVSSAVSPSVQDPVDAETTPITSTERVAPDRVETVVQPATEVAIAAPVQPIISARPETAVQVEQNNASIAPPDATVVTGIASDVVVVEAVPEDVPTGASEPETIVAVPSVVPAQTGSEVPVVTSVQPTTQVQPQTVDSAVRPPVLSVAPPVEAVTAATRPAPVTTTTSSAPVSAVTPNKGAVQAVTSTEVVQDVTVAARPPVSQVESETVPAASASPVQVAPGNVQAVAPAEEQIAAVQPSQILSPSVRPSDPETSSVPAAPTVADPEPSVPPDDVPTIDPLAKVTAYVENYDAGECMHLSVLSAGTNTANVTVFASRINSFTSFDQRFKTDQGYEAQIGGRLVTRRQCALLNALKAANGVEAPSLFELDTTLVRSGAVVSGIVQRDLPLDRIALAEQAGLVLNGKGPPELYLIDNAGQIFDGRSYLRPQTSRERLGGWTFSFPVTLMGSVQSETALLLAVWNRPKENQPSAFGRLPAERIADVLEKPGVYSIEAFKVSR